MVDGFSTPEEYADKAKSIGLTEMLLTDHAQVHIANFDLSQPGAPQELKAILIYHSSV